MSKLKIDDIVNVVVSTAGAATPREGFNVGLIVGVSNHITVADRCKVYSSLESMIDDGFLTTDPEYLAATKYFSQDPAPQKVVIGVKNTADGANESWVDAITACKQKNGDWYGVYVASATALTTAEHQAIAAYIETIIAAYFFDDSTAADLSSGTTDVFAVMKAQPTSVPSACTPPRSMRARLRWASLWVRTTVPPAAPIPWPTRPWPASLRTICPRPTWPTSRPRTPTTT